MTEFETIADFLHNLPGEDQASGPLVLTHQNIDPSTIDKVVFVQSDDNYDTDGKQVSRAEGVPAADFINQKKSEGYEIMTMFVGRDFCFGESTKHVITTVLVKKQQH